jgi:hypothetical protein
MLFSLISLYKTEELANELLNCLPICLDTFSLLCVCVDGILISKYS